MAAIKEEASQAIDLQAQQPPLQLDQSQESASAVAPVKPDKPRPHVCGTCGRSFARLEHLKRHERSHTKEKPFECPQCTRCFARRDLLLRHQQKLHQAGAPSSRLKQGRRGSMSVASTTGRGRKNSMIGDFADVQAKPIVNGHRPRANTISHIGQPPPHFLMGPGLMRAHSGLHSHHASLSGFVHPDATDGLWPSTRNPHLQLHGLPHLDTHHIDLSFTDAMQASPMVDSAASLNMGPFSALGGSTIDPTQLHFDAALGTPGPILEAFGPFSSAIEDDENFHWTGGLGESLLGVNDAQHLDGASPSAISTDSHAVSDALQDNPVTMSHNRMNTWPTTSSMAPPPLVSPQAFAVDPITAALYPELIAHQETISPQALQGNSVSTGYPLASTMSFAESGQYPAASNPGSEYFAHIPMSFEQQNAENTFHSLNWPPSHTPLPEPKFCSISEGTRQVLMASLSQPSGFGHTSRRSISSPTGSLPNPNSPGLFPSTAELQRFINAYVHSFHPHLPFLHLPTLNFNQLVNMNNHRARAPYGGCLILAMAAIGASYEYEPMAGKELFEAAKKLIGFYLEERRNTSALGSSQSSQRTPLWLVQAMLLNLIYGQCCGDKVAADIATTHCAALVSLAKAANLNEADPDVEIEVHQAQRQYIAQFSNIMSTDQKPFSQTDTSELADWIRWKSREERKRALFAVFVLSSLLVSAYNHQPRILNSELNLDLPCEEDLWAAESHQGWTALGAAESAAMSAVTFEAALTFLLTANQRRQGNKTNNVPQVAASRTALSSFELSNSELRPSTFGAYILINALHVYIWDTRQRHHSKRWRAHEVEQMHASIAPALQAWQAAWSSNPRHRLDWPNPHGPLPADCVPLLDLAYVRLFVNLSRCKEAFWQRDFTAMANGLRQSPDYMQSSSRDTSPDLSYGSASVGTAESSPASGMDLMNNDMLADTTESNMNGTSSRARSEQSLHRERCLRKAAFYAADSLSMADTLGTAFLEFSSRELPIQAAICQFDCAQVLAEWLVTVQERVGLYLGVIGRDHIDSIQTSAVTLLEDEDLKLLQKAQAILDNASLKMQQHNGEKPWEQQGNGGLGGRLLRLTAFRLHRAAIWQVANVMAQALIVNAEVVDQRTLASLTL